MARTTGKLLIEFCLINYFLVRAVWPYHIIRQGSFYLQRTWRQPFPPSRFWVFFCNFVLNFVPSQVLPTVVRTLRIDFVDGSPDSLQAAMWDYNLTYFANSQILGMSAFDPPAILSGSYTLSISSPNERTLISPLQPPLVLVLYSPAGQRPTWLHAEITFDKY